MPHVQQGKTRDVMRRMGALGAVFTPRGGTGHFTVSFQGRATTFPMHPSKELGPNFIRTICKQIGMDAKQTLGK